MPTVFLTLLLNSFTFAVTIATTILLLLLLSHYCCHYIIVTTNKLCQAIYFLGAAELTTRFLRLINILWLLLCRINKLGYIYPRRLLRSPTLVGHHSPVLSMSSTHASNSLNQVIPLAYTRTTHTWNFYSFQSKLLVCYL